MWKAVVRSMVLAVAQKIEDWLCDWLSAPD